MSNSPVMLRASRSQLARPLCRRVDRSAAISHSILLQAPAQPRYQQRRLRTLQATAEDKIEETAPAPAPASTPAASQEPVPDTFTPVLAPEDLPKGVRKEVIVNGVSVLLFWYRNTIWAVESRSPAEGAYSEGFINANFTQDYGIICPGTESVFSLKTGEILEWYPNNPVLRLLTPQNTCRPLRTYPVKLTQEALYVDVSSDAGRSRSSRGGADTSFENNNVYGLEPRVYLEGTDPEDGGQVDGDAGFRVADAATLIVGTTAIASVAVVGTALCIYVENYAALGGLWVLLFGTSAFYAGQYTGFFGDKK